MPRHSMEHHGFRKQNPNPAMNDLIYLGVSAAFFAFSALYVRFCEKL